MSGPAGAISRTLPKRFKRSSFFAPGRGTFGLVELALENSIFSGAGAGAGAESAACKSDIAPALQSANAIFRKAVLPDLMRLIFIADRGSNVKKFRA
jgi:hypothetical protein